MSLPDNFTGALLLSVVDFFLSFVFISFIGIAVMCRKNSQRIKKESRVDYEKVITGNNLELNNGVSARSLWQAGNHIRQ